ncbi:unnamed protein product, partial [Ectocarpus sp. 8 AP-2014]
MLSPDAPTSWLLNCFEENTHGIGGQRRPHLACQSFAQPIPRPPAVSTARGGGRGG